jgi:poly-beta-1,6-N-acetyl-D-glucosamine synthase
MPAMDGEPMMLLVIACFLNEEALLPRFLDSLRRQRRRPDRVIFVDDGSSDASAAIVAAFCAEVDYAELLERSQRPTEEDRLASAAELRAFQWGLAQAGGDYDIVVKLDTDLELTETLFMRVEEEFAHDPELGLAGAYLSCETDAGEREREHCPSYHVRGPNKFYRRECYRQIQPLEPFLGWDTVDEVKARMEGWHTLSCALPEGDPVHLRPTGAHDGALRAHRRWGRCAYGYGAAPSFTLLKAAGYCLRSRPQPLAGLNYLWGWGSSYLRRPPRADRDVRRHTRSEQRALIKAAIVSRRGRAHSIRRPHDARIAP